MIEKDTSISNLPMRPVGRILRAEEARVWQDGYSFLEAAQRDVAQLHEGARRDYAEECARAYEDGKAEGAAAAAQIVSETVVKVDRYLAGLEKEVIHLALDVVRRVLGEFDVSMLVAAAVTQALSEIRSAKYLKISVNPVAANIVSEKIGGVLRGSGLGLTVEIDTDETLMPGSCILSTDVAVIDAGLDAQLDAIELAMMTNAEARS